MPDTHRILLVEDEESLADTVRYNLEREGYFVTIVGDGRRALEMFDTEAPSLVILDLMLPGMSGLDVCRSLRERSEVPIIIVTAKDSEADKVTGLELGADDYVTKPFSVRELISRVRANLRRSGSSPKADEGKTLEVGPIRLDPERHEVTVRGEQVEFTPKEFDLLQEMMLRAGRLVTRDVLIDVVWGSDYVGDTNTLDVHVKRLRQKIEERPHDPRHMITVRGLGYRLVGDIDTPPSPR